MADGIGRLEQKRQVKSVGTKTPEKIGKKQEK